MLEIRGRGGKERRLPLPPEAFERLETWLDEADMRDDGSLGLFRPVKTAHGRGHDGFHDRPMTPRAVRTPPFRRCTAARPRSGGDSAFVRGDRDHDSRRARVRYRRPSGFHGHANPRVTLACFRNRDRLSNNPAYVSKMLIDFMSDQSV